MKDKDDRYINVSKLRCGNCKQYTPYKNKLGGYCHINHTPCGEYKDVEEQEYCSDIELRDSQKEEFIIRGDGFRLSIEKELHMFTLTDAYGTVHWDEYPMSFQEFENFEKFIKDIMHCPDEYYEYHVLRTKDVEKDELSGISYGQDLYVMFQINYLYNGEDIEFVLDKDKFLELQQYLGD